MHLTLAELRQDRFSFPFLSSHLCCSAPFFPLFPLPQVTFCPSISADAKHISNATPFSTVLISTSRSLFWNPTTSYLLPYVCVYWVNEGSIGETVEKWHSSRKAANQGAFLNKPSQWAVDAQAWEEALGDGVEQGFWDLNVLQTHHFYNAVRLIWAETWESAFLTRFWVMELLLAWFTVVLLENSDAIKSTWRVRELEYSYTNSGWSFLGALLPPLTCQVAVPDLEKVLRHRSPEACSGKWVRQSQLHLVIPVIYALLFLCARLGIPEGGICTSSSSLAASSTHYTFELILQRMNGVWLLSRLGQVLQVQFTVESSDTL